MIETIIQFKPREEWREGMTADSLRAELDRIVQYPGLTNVWVMPIKTRIDMLATGIKTPVGIKVSGPDLSVIERIGKDIERVLENVPGTASVHSERVVGGRSLDMDSRITEARQTIHALGIVEGEDDLIRLGMVKDITADYTSVYLQGMLGVLHEINSQEDGKPLPDEQRIYKLGIASLIKYPLTFLKQPQTCNIFQEPGC